MTLSSNAVEGPRPGADAPPPHPPATRDEITVLSAASQPATAAPRPAPANWRGCGYRRGWMTLNSGRA